MSQPAQTYYPREAMARVIFSWLFIILAYFFFNNSLLSQMQQSPIIYPGSDNTMWLLHILNIPQFLKSHYGIALAFDIILTVSCLVCIFVPQQRLFTWITITGVWLLYICYGSSCGKYYAQSGYALSILPFLFLNGKKFSFSWEMLRYWVLFLYFTGGVYKIYHGGFGWEHNMSNILHVMNAEWFQFNNRGMQYESIDWLIRFPDASIWLFRLVTIIDLICIVGFFTKRFDKWILLCLVSFHVGNYFLHHISFVEHSLIFAPLLPWQKWAALFIKRNQ